LPSAKKPTEDSLRIICDPCYKNRGERVAAVICCSSCKKNYCLSHKQVWYHLCNLPSG